MQTISKRSELSRLVRAATDRPPDQAARQLPNLPPRYNTTNCSGNTLHALPC